METLGYRNEKKRFEDDPRIEKMVDNVHIRGVFIDKVVLSTAETEARTWGYGELSGGSSSLSVSSMASSDVSSVESGSEDCSAFGMGIPPLLNLLSNPISSATSSASVDGRRLAFDCLRLVLPELSVPSVVELIAFLKPDAFFLFTGRLPSSVSSSSLFSVDAPIGTAPYDPVPKPGEDRRRRGALDISPSIRRNGLIYSVWVSSASSASS
jgi:hypothetical protein